jgi:hypothetical protein
MELRRSAVLAGVVLVAFPSARAASPPKVTHNCSKVHTAPRPCKAAVEVTRHTTLYFELTVPSSAPESERVDPDSVTATLTRSGAAPVTMFGPNRVWAAGFTGRVIDAFVDGTRAGYGFYTDPDAPLLPSATYTVNVSARSLDGTPIDPATASWSFTTRRDLAGSAASWDVDLASTVITWEGRFFSGMVKPNFDTSRLFHQEPVYAMIDEARADAPDFFMHQRDWPLFSDYWNGAYFDGNPNLVRERETRRLTNVRNYGTATILSVADLEEAPLYGIPPNRPPSGDYRAGDRVLVCDRFKCEETTVTGVSDVNRQVWVTQLTNPPESWSLDGGSPGDDPATPDHFSYPPGALRKLSPAGTPVYYWRRLDDEWDQHVAHGRKPHVNFDSPGYDLCKAGRSRGTYGGDCPNLPKDWLEWHGVIRALVDHLVDRYGPAIADWYWSVGNEHNLDGFWEGTDDEALAYHDYTANAALHALESRGIDTARVRIAGPEAAGAADPSGYIQHLFYHASPTAVDPAPGFDERNRVCMDPAFAGLRASRVQAFCDQGGFGTPLDVAVIHAYKRAADAASSLIDVRRKSLAIDPIRFERLPVNSHETTPDWVTTRDPGGREVYRWGGYFQSWGGDYFRRMLDEGTTDPRKRAGEVTLTVWPYNINFHGSASVVGQVRIDENADGVLDRVDAIHAPFFHFAHLAATMSHDLAPLPVRQDAGVTMAGWRSVEPAGDKLLLYAHDPYDTPTDETGGWDVTLRLRNLRFPVVEVLEYRLDTEHPARAALAALPDRGTSGLYAPEEVAPLADAARLRTIGTPVRYAVDGGALDLTTRLLAGSVVLLDVRRPDPDGDGVYDPDDCAPLDPQTYREPRVDDLGWTDAVTLSWASAIPAGGPSTVHDVSREPACLASGITASTWTDAEVPAPGAAFRYLVRGRNACGASWGRASDGSERAGACP